MRQPLRILIVEDNPDDIMLCLAELQKANIEATTDIVSSLAEFEEKVFEDAYDVIVADYHLSGWTGTDALELLRERNVEIPFLVVTGAIGEEKAVECIKKGAADYILKNHLARLPAAILRSVEEKTARDERERAKNALRESEERFRVLAETIASAIFVYEGTRCRYANRAAEELTGYNRKELLEISSWEIVHPDSRDVLIEKGLGRLQGGDAPLRFEIKILTKQGETKWADLTLGRIVMNGQPAGLFTAFDITSQKAAVENSLVQASCDPLTGLLNVHRLLEIFDAEAKRFQRTARPFALLEFDLNGLKTINDNYGHLVGSRALCRVANVLRAQCRNIDFAARYGGDEFSVVLPETTVEGALRFAQRISERLSTDGLHPVLSVSYGAAVYPGNGKTFEEVFTVADQALYEMKNRSRVTRSQAKTLHHVS